MLVAVRPVAVARIAGGRSPGSRAVEAGHGARAEKAERGAGWHQVTERAARRHPQLFQLGFLEPLGFGPSVLEPNLHLSFGERQGSGEFRPFGDGQVLFLAEFLLQRHQLLGGERSPRLAVGLVLAQLATQLTARRQLGQSVEMVALVETGRQFAQIRSIF